MQPPAGGAPGQIASPIVADCKYTLNLGSMPDSSCACVTFLQHSTRFSCQQAATSCSTFRNHETQRFALDANMYRWSFRHLGDDCYLCQSAISIRRAVT